MNSVFSFLQPPQPENTADNLAEAATPSAEGSPTAAAVPARVTLAPTSAPNMSQVLQQMLAHLDGFLPTPAGGVPQPSIIVLSLNDAPVGLGNFIGSTPGAPFGQTEVKGGRLDTLIRFILWGENIQQVNDLMLTLQGDLLAARANLWDLGFLTFVATTSTNPQFDATLNAWSRSADYSLLYEYQYVDTDAAQSLIARIPIHADQEILNSPDRENTLVTDEMARWDDLTAPILAARGPTTFSHLSALAFVASTIPTGTVTLIRTHEGATGALQDYPTLTDFLNALADPVVPERHGRVIFANLTDFLAQFSPAGTTLHLGDWNLDTIPDEYQGLDLELSPPIQLHESFDRLEVMYGNGSEPLDQVAVMYLKLKN